MRVDGEEIIITAENAEEAIDNAVINTLDKIKGYIDHIRNTGMGKEKSLDFIEKYIEGIKAESEG